MMTSHIGHSAKSHRLMWGVFCGVGLLALLLFAGLPTALRRGAMRAAEAQVIRNIGHAVIKYNVCLGELPTCLQDLEDVGLAIVAPEADTLEIVGLSTYPVPSDVIARVRIADKATYLRRHDENNVSNGRAARRHLPLVWIVDSTEGDLIDQAMAYVDECWDDVQQGLPLKDRWIERWLHDCGDGVGKEMQHEQSP